MPGGMYTPWGVAQTQQQLDSGVFWVTTAEHGGILIEQETARATLSEKALRIGRPWHDFVAFGQEDEMMVVLYEQPEWYPWIEEDLTIRFAEDFLRRSHPEYFAN